MCEDLFLLQLLPGKELKVTKGPLKGFKISVVFSGVESLLLLFLSITSLKFQEHEVS